MPGNFLLAALAGAGATLALDLWTLLLNRWLGLPMPNWALFGRWLSGLPAGRFVHADGIGKAPPVANERALGWIGHYAVGVLFGLALAVISPGWVTAPTLLPALIVGWVTILCGWLVLSPAYGNGIAAARTANPTRARLVNIAGHTVFGFGLWGSALLLRAMGW